MRRKRFCRIGSWLLAALMLLSVLAVPVAAEDSYTDNEYQTFFYSDVKTAGDNLLDSVAWQVNAGYDRSDGNIPYATGRIELKAGATYYVRLPSYDSVTLRDKENTAYFTASEYGYVNKLIHTRRGDPSYLLFHKQTPDQDISEYFVYAVASYRNYYDMSSSSFSVDAQNLFPSIDLAKYTGTSDSFVELITICEDIREIKESGEVSGTPYLYFFNPSGIMVDSGSFTYTVAGKTYTAELSPIGSADFRFVKAAVKNWGCRYKIESTGAENRHVRRYDIGDMTLTYAEGSQRTFRLNGYFIIEDQISASNAQSDAANGAAALSDTTEEITARKVTGKFESTVELEVNYTYYRTDTSPNGAYYHNQVDSIYFNVPKRLQEDYGKLVDVKLSYQRARTQPIIVTDNAGIYKALRDNLGQDATTYNSKIPELWWVQQIGGGQNKTVLGFSYNVDLTGRNAKSNRILSPLRSVFLVDDVHAGVRASGSSVSRSALTDWMYAYTKKFPDINYLQGANGSVSSHFFSKVEDVSVVNVASLNLNADSFKENHGFFSQWANYGFLYALGGTSTDASLDLSDKIVTIERDWQLAGNSDKLYYAEADEKDLQNCFRKSELTDSTMYLVRFNVSQYYQRSLASRFNGSTCNDGDGSAAYVAEQDVYLNLHVLELTYENDLGVETVVPVVSNRIDGIADITDEKDPEQINQEAGQNLFQNLMDKLGQIGKLFALILGIVVLVLIVVFVVPVVSPIFKAIFGAIGSLFRWIRDKIRGASAKRKQRKSKRK